MDGEASLTTQGIWCYLSLLANLLFFPWRGRATASHPMIQREMKASNGRGQPAGTHLN